MKISDLLVSQNKTKRPPSPPLIEVSPIQTPKQPRCQCTDPKFQLTEDTDLELKQRFVSTFLHYDGHCHNCYAKKLHAAHLFHEKNILPALN